MYPRCPAPCTVTLPGGCKTSPDQGSFMLLLPQSKAQQKACNRREVKPGSTMMGHMRMDPTSSREKGCPIHPSNSQLPHSLTFYGYPMKIQQLLAKELSKTVSNNYSLFALPQYLSCGIQPYWIKPCTNTVLIPNSLYSKYII